MISELVLNRILSTGLKSNSAKMRSEIILDTTPVPMFGKYQDSQIVTVGINPSSKEFPTENNNRRLVHLSDIGLPPSYYRDAADNMTTEQASIIEKGLVNYFMTENAYWDWFGYAEDALNIGLESSYKSDHSRKIASHLDIFPWATRRVSSLDPEVRAEFFKENTNFVANYLSQDSIKEVLILGNDSKNGLMSQLTLNFKCLRSDKGPQSSTFEIGLVAVGNSVKRYFYTSKGPSAHLPAPEKKRIHIEFGEFIKANKDQIS